MRIAPVYRYGTPTYTSGDAVALDFRKRVELARAAADTEDMDDAMSGPLPEEVGEAVGEEDPIVCCPKCQHEFPESEGFADEEGAPQPVLDTPSIPDDDMMPDDFSGFSVGAR